MLDAHGWPHSLSGQQILERLLKLNLERAGRDDTAFDRAVLDAYGWPHSLSDEGILEHLLRLNLERVGR